MTTGTTTKKAPAKATKPAAAKPTSKKAATPTLAQAAAKGDVKIVRQRGNGTFRRLPYLAPGTPERKSAEAVVARREKGDTIDALCKELKLSKATVRRMINGLLLARAIEAGEHDKAWDGKAERVILAGPEKAA
jgi:hypothetical protein